MIDLRINTRSFSTVAILGLVHAGMYQLGADVIDTEIREAAESLLSFLVLYMKYPTMVIHEDIPALEKLFERYGSELISS